MFGVLVKSFPSALCYSVALWHASGYLLLCVMFPCSLCKGYWHLFACTRKMRNPALESLPCSQVSPFGMWDSVRRVHEYTDVSVKVKFRSTLHDLRSVCGSLKVWMQQIGLPRKVQRSLVIGVKLFWTAFVWYRHEIFSYKKCLVRLACVLKFERSGED